MNWWGKLIGTGVGMFGGPIGALAGAAIGHLYDEDDPTPQNERKARILYLAYFFSCAAKISKADGGVSSQEISMTESLMDRFGLDDKTKEFAKNVFRKAKNSKRSIDDDFKEVAKLIGFEQTIAQSFVGGLFEIVKANGRKTNELQLRFLLRAEERFKLQPGTVQSWFKNGYKPPQEVNSESQISLDEAYEILEVKRIPLILNSKKLTIIKLQIFIRINLKAKTCPMNLPNLQMQN